MIGGSKKIWIFATMFILFLMIIFYSGPPDDGNVMGDKKTPIVKIGVIAPLTGKGAVWGESALMGLQLAQEKVQAESDVQIDLVVEDLPFGESKKAPVVFNKLVEVDQVTTTIGPMGSNEALAISSLVDQKQIPIIVHTASALEITKNNEYVFRLWPTAESFTKPVLKRLRDQKYKKVASLTTIRDNTIDYLETLKKQAPDVDLVIDERVNPEAKDFRTSLIKVKNSDADILLLNLFEGQIGVAAKQAKQLGIELPFFGNGVMSAIELEVAEGALEGIWFPKFGGYSNQIKQEFLQKFSSEPASRDSAVSAHDALLILTEVINAVGTNPEKIKNHLYRHSFQGAMGTIKFQETGDSQVPVILETVKGGKILQLKE